MTEDPAAPGEPHTPPPEPPRTSPFWFAGGFVLALVLAPGPTIFIGMLFSQAPAGVWLACLAELAVFGVLFWFARRKRLSGFPQGLVTGLAVAFLLAAACWGVIGSWR